MKPTIYIALFGWPVVSLLFFAMLRPRRAMLASLVVGWLLLPIAGYKLAGVPEYNKVTAVCGGTLLGVALFDLRRMLSFRPSLRDLPMLCWCLSPFFSSVLNDLGVHDGFTAVYYKVMLWGVPYLLGRLYCSDLSGMFEMACAIFLGGLLYVPACLYEIRMSPQLHAWVYGFHQHEFSQTFRFGGWRPMVFMDHGIMVGMWMSMATLAGCWLYFSRSLRSLGRLPLPWLLIPLAVTTVLCKSMGALVLMGVGLGFFLIRRFAVVRPLLLTLGLLPILYFALRIPQVWSGNELAEVSAMVDPDRAYSLQFRMVNENMLIDRACLRPVFGWGGWGRARVHDSMGQDISITDGLWIIEFGNYGLVGLSCMAACFLVPLWGFWALLPRPAWKHPLVSPALGLCVIVLLFALDCVFNAMVTPVFMAAAGGLSCLSIGAIRRSSPQRAPIPRVPCARPS